MSASSLNADILTCANDDIAHSINQSRSGRADRRFESEPVERDEPRALKPRPEVSARKDEHDGNAPHPTPREHGYLTVAENLLRDALHPAD